MRALAATLRGSVFVLLTASIAPACDDECVPETVCAYSAEVTFAPTIERQGGRLDVEANLDGTILRCRLTGDSAQLLSDVCDSGLELSFVTDARRLRVNPPRTPTTITIRVLRDGVVVREATLTPQYTDYPFTCGPCRQAATLTM